MSVLKNIQSLCNLQNTSVPKLELELGFSRGSMYNWDKNSPSADKVQKVAKYFNTSTDFLLSDQPESPIDLTVLSRKEERDIAHDLEKMLSDLESDNAMAFYGESMDDDDKELLRISLDSSMRLAKQMAKKKFNPNKNKK